MLLHSTPVHGQKQSLIQISTVDESPIPCPTKQIGAVADNDPCSMLNEQADESTLTYICICYAPINVKPQRGGGRAYVGHLICQTNFRSNARLSGKKNLINCNQKAPSRA